MSNGEPVPAGRARVRLVAVVIQPSVVVDDGELLTELRIDPIKVSAADWPKVVALLETARLELENQVNEGDDTTTD